MAFYQCDPHLGDDPQVGLGEQAVRQRTEAVGEQLPRVAPRQGAHAGAHHLTGGAARPQSRLPHEVIAIRGVAHAAIGGVADNRTPTKGGAVQHQGRRVGLQMLIQVELVGGDADRDQDDHGLAVVRPDWPAA